MSNRSRWGILSLGCAPPRSELLEQVQGRRVVAVLVLVGRKIGEVAVVVGHVGRVRDVRDVRRLLL